MEKHNMTALIHFLYKLCHCHGGSDVCFKGSRPLEAFLLLRPMTLPSPTLVLLIKPNKPVAFKHIAHGGVGQAVKWPNRKMQ